MKLHALLLLAATCTACSSNDDALYLPDNPKGEYIYRTHNESHFAIAAPEKNTPPSYPWDTNKGAHAKITKEFFRCNGSALNPCHIVQMKENEEVQRHHDCSGQHSLPLRDGKEFIYPILIDLVNFIQDETGKKVVITCGHRCPDHNTYADPTPSNQYSKHMVGAEVSFYVQGLENNPEQIVTLIHDFYKKNPRTRGQKDYEDFKRYEKNDANVTTNPWFNKEVYVKIFSKTEGRNFDNRHPFPYLSIQVRHDRDTNEKVIYTWEKGFKNYHRR